MEKSIQSFQKVSVGFENLKGEGGANNLCFMDSNFLII